MDRCGRVSRPTQLIAVDDAHATFDLRLRRISLPTFAHRLEKMAAHHHDFDSSNTRRTSFVGMIILNDTPNWVMVHRPKAEKKSQFKSSIRASAPSSFKFREPPLKSISSSAQWTSSTESELEPLRSKKNCAERRISSLINAALTFCVR